MAHYRFDNLLGAPYRGGNLCVRGTKLFTSIGNRVTEVDLTLSSCATLPSENLTEIQCVAVSPSGSHIISFDTDGRAILVNLRCVERSGRSSLFRTRTTREDERRARGVAALADGAASNEMPLRVGPSLPLVTRAEDDTTHEYLFVVEN